MLFIPGCASTPGTPSVAPTPVIQQKATLTQPPTAPILRLNNSMHTAMIKSISTDAQERFVLTASSDKTARLWSLDDGHLLRTFHPPQGAGNEGKLYAAALSPDGETVALAGWTKAGENSHNIYLFQRQSGQLLRRLTGLPNVIFHLSFSTDGRYLAASLGGKNGIRVFEPATGHQVFKDSDYASDSDSVDFAADGRLVANSDDGELRLYSAGFKLLAKQSAAGGKRPASARFSPNG